MISKKIFNIDRYSKYDLKKIKSSPETIQKNEETNGRKKGGKEGRKNGCLRENTPYAIH